MKTFGWIIIPMVAAFTACSDYGRYGDSDYKDWDKGGQKYYSRVIDLQTEAGEKYSTWSQSMDSLEAIKKLQQFFLDDTIVSSATIGSQGIAVQYTSGMRGGLFLDPKNGYEEGPGSSGPPATRVYTSMPLKSMVNKRNAICLFACYWQYVDVLDGIERLYSERLPSVGMALTRVYQNTAVTVERFTELAGFGLIHIDSHGWAWPDTNHIQEVYMQTGELVNEITAKNFWNDLNSGEVMVSSGLIGKKGMRTNCYFISPGFIASHNDFSKDTVLFFGGFCFSNLGRWPELYKNFGEGGSFGFDWSVHYERQDDWGRSLIDHLCNEKLKPPGNTGDWMNGPMQKWYFDLRSKKNVRIQYNGDPTLTLWQAPQIITLAVENTTSTTAQCGGNVISDGGIPVTEKGICWSTSENPTIKNSRTLEPGGTGSFVNTIDHLTPLTQYWVRAYATNSSGTYYGKQIPFITEESTENTFEYEGRRYKYVTIGTQTWMAENLAWLPLVHADSMGSETQPRYYVMNNCGTDLSAAKALDNYQIYGVLYNLPAALKACPPGWHLPGEMEWQKLEVFLGMDSIEVNSPLWRGVNEGIGDKLKSNSFPNGNNSSGFNALSGGLRETDQAVGTFYAGLGSRVAFWSSTTSEDVNGKIMGAHMRELGSSSGIWSMFYKGSFGYSVRCIKD